MTTSSQKSTTTPPSGSRGPTPFDRKAALTAASHEVEKAMRVAKAVESFHEASERAESAQQVIAEASRVRREAVREMRRSGYSAARISELTGVSASTVQKMLSPKS